MNNKVSMAGLTYILGIDGGGTTTIACLAGIEGKTIAIAQGGPSNLQTAGADNCADLLNGLLNEICAKSSISPGDIQIVVYGTAGAGRQADRELLHASVMKSWEKLETKPLGLKVVSDADVALEAAFGGDSGIIIIAGTGSIIYGRDIDGSLKRAGGWGHIIGDPGSGTSIGKSALRVVAQTIDGILESTLLAETISDQVGINSAESLVEKIYREKYPPSALAPIVIQAAEKGDTYAEAIIKSTVGDLVSLLECGMRKFTFSDNIPVAFAGGLLLSQTMYPEKVREKIKERMPNVQIRKPRYRPEEGAAALGIRLYRSEEKT